MIDVHQNLGFVETFFCQGSRVIDNRCKLMEEGNCIIQIIQLIICNNV